MNVRTFRSLALATAATFGVAGSLLALATRPGSAATGMMPGRALAMPLGHDRFTLGPGRGWTTIESFSFLNATSRDASSGLEPGKRRHEPIVIRKEIDAASPRLFRALATNEVFPSVVFEFHGGTYSLQKALVTSVHHVTAGGHELEEVSFTYQKIEWTLTKGGKSFTDEWSAP
jgi:type VI secretion system secreted protein Hcp